MRILTLENKTFFLNDLPDEVDDGMRFSVLDNSDPNNSDYFFIPLIFLESFTAPAAVLQIGPYNITMPLDWCTVVGDPEGPEMEVLPLTSLNDRGFKTFCFNPLSSFRPTFFNIDIIDVYQLLTTPLHAGEKPTCSFFVKEVSRQSEILDYTKCW